MTPNLFIKLLNTCHMSNVSSEYLNSHIHMVGTVIGLWTLIPDIYFQATALLQMASNANYYVIWLKQTVFQLKIAFSHYK